MKFCPFCGEELERTNGSEHHKGVYVKAVEGECPGYEFRFRKEEGRPIEVLKEPSNLAVGFSMLETAHRESRA